MSHYGCCFLTCLNMEKWNIHRWLRFQILSNLIIRFYQFLLQVFNVFQFLEPSWLFLTNVGVSHYERELLAHFEHSDLFILSTYIFLLAALIKKILSRSSRPEVLSKKGVLRNFTKFTGKHLRQSLFFNKDFFIQNTSGGCFCLSKYWLPSVP